MAVAADRGRQGASGHTTLPHLFLLEFDTSIIGEPLRDDHIRTGSQQRPSNVIPRVNSATGHECNAVTRVHHHLIPGEGVINFGATLKALKDVGYADWVTIELYTCHENPDEAARVARERVLKFAKRVGVEFAM